MSAGQMYRIVDFVSFEDLESQLKYLPKEQFPEAIKDAELHLFMEIPFDKNSNDYVFLTEINGPLIYDYDKELHTFTGYSTDEYRLVDYRGMYDMSTGEEYYLHSFSRLWFKKSEVENFIAQNQQYVTLDAVPVMKDKRQWRAEYPLFATVVDWIEQGKSREEIAVKLDKMGYSQAVIGLFLRPSLNGVQDGSLRRYVQRLNEDK